MATRHELHFTYKPNTLCKVQSVGWYYSYQTHRLEHVAVLKQPLLGYMRLLQLDTQVQVFEHDWLQHTLAPTVGPFFVAKHFVQRVQSTGWLANLNELCSAQQTTLLMYSQLLHKNGLITVQNKYQSQLL